ncbi:XTP/dITP diphosphohydrolase [Clostridium tetanomorphum]|uniref:dITP/XTP pyrophosphatase n=1 Tax=Clostridium tetanomorphum TaxID=1553 RepID=A0A923J2I2_CLOTT|nr:XTP/dITP diphosphatase [Clostridium tetanomorphum]KAJ52881.1 dITP/XTP pyrophosphatase [Clostridium tetanomorphum DSM 665]MBC2399909.1 XTP/dITP diphosphatase [Clostridium tetanomorphum]MBP1865982.1 XTP/dITP diphosphohydrolase [Clostridium tetanomorphum]NRS85964.1 XTP/dITP diphosphohydrolase [Clostridium tetanomorphum]NRZ96026.1 XTP/dITP diphosphohydrolase [Clostridium tetanomorphum]
MKKLILASNNENKVREIKEILKELNIQVISLKEAGINIDIEEDGKTFMENAYKKATGIFDLVKDKEYMVLADDSGLSVEALSGAPGVYSARFAGEHGDTKKNNCKLLKEMQNVENRNAKFICTMVLIIDTKNVIEAEGELEGTIIEEERGTNGFGYDPLFYVPKYNMTFAEMDSKLKNSISHRKKALINLEEKLVAYLQGE